MLVTRHCRLLRRLLAVVVPLFVCHTSLLSAASLLTMLTGQPVSLDGRASEGHPTGYDWYVTLHGASRSETPYSEEPVLTFSPSQPGDWDCTLVAHYGHTVEGTPYTSEATATITVHSVIAAVSVLPAVGLSDATVTLDGSGSLVATGVTPDVTWVVSGPALYLDCPNEMVCSIPPNSLLPGTYTVELTLRDPVTGDTTIARVPLVIELSGVSADFEWTRSPLAPSRITFNAALSSTYSSIATATWDFGDGTQESSGCTRLINCSRVYHNYEVEGIHHVTLTAYDLQGHSNVARHSVASGDIIFFTDFESPELTDWSDAVP